MTPLPAYLIAAVPEDCPGSLDRVSWESGLVVVSFLTDTYTHAELVTPIQGVSAQDNEIHAVQVAALGLLAGLVQHRIEWGHDVSDDDLTDALAAATMRGDMDVADLLDLATARGIGPVETAPAVMAFGYRH